MSRSQAGKSCLPCRGEPFLRIGDPVPLSFLDEPPRIIADDPLLKPQVDSPWFRAYAAERLGSPVGPAFPGVPR